MNKEIIVPVRRKERASFPTYATLGAAGADLKACIEADITLEPRQFLSIPTGLFFAIPEGFEMQIRPRSGLAAKYGITVLNAPGTIDSDYRGELRVILVNLGYAPFVIIPDMRIAQIVLAPVCKAVFIEEKKLATTVRGEGGFGHTGLH